MTIAGLDMERVEDPRVDVLEVVEIEFRLVNAARLKYPEDFKYCSGIDIYKGGAHRTTVTPEGRKPDQKHLTLWVYYTEPGDKKYRRTAHLYVLPNVDAPCDGDTSIDRIVWKTREQ